METVEMKCAKLQLQERTKIGPKESTADGPRRYCQRRLVDPDQDLWIIFFGRFRFNEDANLIGSYYNGRLRQGADDLYLSVQNLQFQGVEQQRKRPRTSFKYKTLPSRQHRMFVKELVEDNLYEGGRCSELTCYYYDDYAKYLINNDRSRPSSGKSSIFLFDAIEKPKENVAKNKVRTKALKTAKSESNKKKPNEILNGDKKDLEPHDKDTKISYHKSGKRKSLTISRADSPATLQVIRVDVVCNYCTSSISDYEDTKQTKSQDITNEKVAKGDSHFANKYLLTNTVKTLDENAGGARVTLLCKTFKLADRSGLFAENKAKSLKIRRN
ncbi:uncharacterized protein LOC125062617 [Pieris napi]|uniref:uncharacterized protein LOC125062617 n=1 Tax=Pieris napi TaxID=78633 RepID=UPI001FBA1B9A|nr:uncharacterized protein LOC125062617 [Pieris napi]